MMAEAKKMMESPEFQKQMKQLEKSKDFKEAQKKAKDMMSDPQTAARMQAQMEHMVSLANGCRKYLLKSIHNKLPLLIKLGPTWE